MRIARRSQRMYRVINVNNYCDIRGGSDRCFVDLYSILTGREHRVFNFYARKVGEFEDAELPAQININKPKPSDLGKFVYNFEAAKSLRTKITAFKPDLAHLHIFYGQLTSSILRPLKDAHIPIIQTLHEYKTVCPVSSLISNGQVCQSCGGSSFWRATVKRCNRGSIARSLLSTVEAYISKILGAVKEIDHFIAVSDFVKNKVIELGLPPDKITTIHNFKDVSRCYPSAKQGEYFLYFGRLEDVKGVFTLLKASASIKDVPLLIVGEGSARLKLDAVIRQQSLQHVRIVGFKTGAELESLIRNSICTIVPSEWYETFGLTLLESFAYGRPVIASKIGGIPEVVADGRDGVLVSPGSADELREKMMWMSQHRREAVDMGMAGRRKVETLFNPDAYYEKLMGVYRKVVIK